MAASTFQGDTGSGPGDPDCVKLAAANEEERKTFINKLEKKRKGGLTKDEKSSLKMAKRGGMTYSSGKSSCLGSSVMTQTSNKLSNASINGAADYGGKPGQYVGLNAKARKSSNPSYYKNKKKEAEVLNCDGSPYIHPGGGYGSHAEAKIMNNLSNRAKQGGPQGCSVLFSIDWRQNAGPPGEFTQSGMPCTTCFKMLCHAAKKCEIDIIICDKKQVQKPFPEDCEDDKAYEDLRTNIDGSGAG